MVITYSLSNISQKLQKGFFLATINTVPNIGEEPEISSDQANLECGYHYYSIIIDGFP
jgi:hypothetical protein